ncbi:hypothetical protein FB567DRAFT_9825 [Paraphoma chrysanthemicola]|uniref:Uncharacterized protein n=1 Tax=Paraphoma chrysanthemicola TaxID=798071 RepID=A0A8K0RG39_9PLEO|nr:hypothetical protein FB567DRAFT_9825 [Paraphoma chrysanthemicola]
MHRGSYPCLHLHRITLLPTIGARLHFLVQYSSPSFSFALSMPSSSGSTEFALQICFGVFGIISTIATLASLHHRESLGCILIRRLSFPRPLGTNHHDDLESSIASYEDNTELVDDAMPLERRSTMPPAYEQSDCSRMTLTDSEYPGVDTIHDVSDVGPTLKGENRLEAPSK